LANPALQVPHFVDELQILQLLTQGEHTAAVPSEYDPAGHAVHNPLLIAKKGSHCLQVLDEAQVEQFATLQEAHALVPLE